MQVNAIANQPNFKGLDILEVKPVGKEGKVLMVMDADKFERHILPAVNELADLGDAPGSMNGRPIINKIVENQDQIQEVLSDLKESVQDGDGGFLETIMDFLKGLVGLDD